MFLYLSYLAFPSLDFWAWANTHSMSVAPASQAHTTYLLDLEQLEVVGGDGVEEEEDEDTNTKNASHTATTTSSGPLHTRAADELSQNHSWVLDWEDDGDEDNVSGGEGRKMKDGGGFYDKYSPLRGVDMLAEGHRRSKCNHLVLP